MTLAAIDKVFAGSIPQIYQSHFVPLIFEPYAADLAKRLADRKVSRVLEIAAGTGVVTRALDQALDERVEIVATDLNPGMLEQARALGTRRTVDWRTADAMALPFDDASFDCVVCQFGAMFFPDKARAFAEARRVLKAGGVFVFNVWDRIDTNEFADVVTRALEPMFPADPPRFLARTPHGYSDTSTIARDLAAGGFAAPPQIDPLELRSRAAGPRVPAIAFCQGTPLRHEIEVRDAARLLEATDTAAAALAARFGSGAIDGRMRAHVVTVVR